MTLGDKQRLFAKLFAELVLWVYDQGYEVTYGEFYRSDEQAVINVLGPVGRQDLCSLLERNSATNLRFHDLSVAISNNTGSGILKTLHGLKIAADINLFLGGRYLSDSDAYQFAGNKWKAMHPENRWGGDFSTPDGNHFSIEHEGVK